MTYYNSLHCFLLDEAFFCFSFSHSSGNTYVSLFVVELKPNTHLHPIVRKTGVVPLMMPSCRWRICLLITEDNNFDSLHLRFYLFRLHSPLPPHSHTHTQKVSQCHRRSDPRRRLDICAYFSSQKSSASLSGLYTFIDIN